MNTVTSESSVPSEASLDSHEGDIEPGRQNPESGQSRAMQQSPRLSHQRLTFMLAFMCLVPVITILALWSIMPPVYEGQLEASVRGIGLPPAEYYLTDYKERAEVPAGELLVRNESDQDWTHLNIQVNRHYQIYDIEPIPSKGERIFKLDRFVSRTGARFQVRYNPLKAVRIYARRPTRDRATFYHEFDWQNESNADSSDSETN